MIYKTENFVTVLEELSAAHEAKAAFDRALLAMNAGERPTVRKQLDQSQTALDRANRLVREAAQQMIPYAQIPTERHILYLFNDASRRTKRRTLTWPRSSHSTMPRVRRGRGARPNNSTSQSEFRRQCGDLQSPGQHQQCLPASSNDGDNFPGGLTWV